MNRPTISAFRKKALQDPEVRKAYEALKPEYELKKKLIALRKAKGLTQEQMAELLHTKKSSISRLESLGYGSSPRFETLESYAEALGYRLKVELEEVSQTYSLPG